MQFVHTPVTAHRLSVCILHVLQGNMKQHMLTHKTRDMSSGGGGSNAYDVNSTSCGHDDTASNASSESREALHQHQHQLQHQQQQQQQMMLLSAAAAANSAAAAAAVAAATATPRSVPLSVQLMQNNAAGAPPPPPPPPPPATVAAISAANASTCTSAADLTSPPPSLPPAHQQQQPTKPVASTAACTLTVPSIGQLSNNRKSVAPSTVDGLLSSSTTSSSSPKRTLPDSEVGLPTAKRQPSEYIKYIRHPFIYAP